MRGYKMELNNKFLELLTRKTMIVMTCLYNNKAYEEYVKQDEVIKEFEIIIVSKLNSRHYIKKVLTSLDQEYDIIKSTKIGRAKAYKIKQDYIHLFEKLSLFIEELLMID